MHDPFPLPRSERLAALVEPFANYVGLRTLPLHIHEVLFAFTLYHATNKYIAPAFSRFFFPRIYATFNARTKVNWDVHIVSFVQSTLINILALYVMWQDDERRDMNWEGRVWGYTGAGGVIQGFAAGYFLWDLAITLQNISMFGPGMLAHAMSALFVFSLGFRPFVNFYAPSFILYELSSPFLNIHWFCDKLNLTGSKIQLYNGIILLVTFFSCRLVWGSYQSFRVFSDIYQAIQTGSVVVHDPELGTPHHNATSDPSPLYQTEMMRFAGNREVPLWLAFCYLASNMILNGLNWFWFAKMIATIRKRFDPPLGTRKVSEKVAENAAEDEKVLVEGIHVETPGVVMNGNGSDYLDVKESSVDVQNSSRTLEVRHTEVRSRSVSARRRG